MENLQNILCDLLSCGYLDLKFLDELIWAYSLDLDIESLSFCYNKIDNINILIYEALEEVKNIFLDENYEVLEKLGYDSEQFNDSIEYEIFTNYLDSHLWFKDKNIDDIYQEWRKC